MSQDHLDSVRIRKMAALRRAAIRTRSYALIAVGLCSVGAAELVFYAFRGWPRPINLRGVCVVVFYVLCAGGLVALGLHFMRLALRFHHELKASSLEAPRGEPDFSPLQNGSQFAKNLEELNASPDDQATHFE